MLGTANRCGGSGAVCRTAGEPSAGARGTGEREIAFRDDQRVPATVRSGRQGLNGVPAIVLRSAREFDDDKRRT